MISWDFPEVLTTSLVQWLRLCASNAGGVGSILGWGTKIPYAMQHGQKIKMKRHPVHLACLVSPL